MDLPFEVGGSEHPTREDDSDSDSARALDGVYEGRRNGSRAASRALKRLIDVAGATLILLVLSPLFLLIAAAIALTSPGPVLFRQTRVGYKESSFVMFKFRTMYVDRDDSAHRAYVTALLTEGECPNGGTDGVYKLSDDPRITRVGALLRRTSLDELTQVFNVLKGDMSLVGPRPSLPWEVELFEPRFHLRFAVRPGITGLWQVSGRNTLTMREALDLDVHYARNHRLVSDLGILLKTIPAVVRGGGAR